MTEPKQEIEAQGQDRRDFIDPATTATIGWFVLVEVSKACLAFFTMKILRTWWQAKFGKSKEDVGTDYQGIFEEESGKEG